MALTKVSRNLLNTSIVDNGNATAITIESDGSVTFSSTISASGYNNSNWDTAYSWGNHASQSYATQSYVNTQVANLVDSAPSTLDTLNELASALGDDANFSTTVTNSIATKLPLAGGSLTGNLSTNSKISLSSSHTKQKIEVYGGGHEWIGTSGSTLELSGANINLNGGQGTGTPNLKMGGTTVIDSSRNLTNIGTLNGGTPWHSGNDGSGSGLDADLLDGLQADVSVIANTIVARQGNGYIYANHINFSTSETENPTINSFFVSNGDGWSRKASKAHVVNTLASDFITTSATQANNITIRNGSPTLYLRDTNNNSSMVHCNSNIFYVLRGGNDTQGWSQVNGRWPLQINLTNNDATFGGNVTAYSDERLKENIKPIGNSVEMFEKIDAKRFDWIDGGKSDIGFIAQDVQKAGLTEVVKEAEKRDPDTGELQDTNLTLDYSRMVSVLWDVVKELKAEVDELKGVK